MGRRVHPCGAGPGEAAMQAGGGEGGPQVVKCVENGGEVSPAAVCRYV